MDSICACSFLLFLARAVFLPQINILEQKSDSSIVCSFKAVHSLGLSPGEEKPWES